MTDKEVTAFSDGLLTLCKKYGVEDHITIMHKGNQVLPLTNALHNRVTHPVMLILWNVICATLQSISKEAGGGFIPPKPRRN